MDNILKALESAWKGAVEFLQQDVNILGNDLKTWMLFAAGSGLILIVLVVILIITGKKGKQTQNEGIITGLHTEMEPDENMEPQAQPEQQILSIGDEPTVNLEETTPVGGIVMSADAETTDLPLSGGMTTPLEFLVQVQMHYAGMVSEPREWLRAGHPLVIGRGDGEDVTIHTNPSDTSVSHHHGVIYIQDDKPWYRDESRNGTILNGTRTLRRDESVQLPLQTKVTLEIGTHKVLLFIVKQ